MDLLDLEKVCRGCLSKNGEMRNLYGSCLDKMLMTVAEVHVEVGDGLPEKMCVQCVLQVSRAFTFKQQCERSDTTLRSYFQTIQESMASTVTVNDETTGTQSVEVQFQDPNGEKCFLVVQQISMMNTDDLVTFSDDNKIVGNVICQEDVVGTETNEANDSLSDINFANDDVIKLEDSPSLALVDVEDLESEIITDSYDTYSNDDSASNTQNIILTADDAVTELLFQTEEVADENTFTEPMEPKDQEQQPQDDPSIMPDEKLPPSPEETTNLRFACEFCHKRFAENKILKRHLKIHSPNKPHVCSVCNMSFAESSNLTKHKKKHTGELRNVVGKPNLCSVCGKGFKWASSLSKHMKHHTKHKILNCPYCPKYYVEARSLNIHIRNHTGEKPYVCNICNKGFTQLGNLEKHTRVHTGDKPFNCPICNKNFSQSGYVTIHLRTHTGERPYHCSECGKGFAGSNTLAIHKRTHTGERNFGCNMCDKTFARKETAVIHQRTHTGLKPHICKICNRGFASSGHLTGHMRSHSGIKNHECTICKKRYAGGNTLKAHMKSHDTKAQLTITEILLPNDMAMNENADTAIKSEMSIGP
ncbi:hypothetical protein HA402_010794 [Bradysia odoriphaga]|nr:hypothetical protein HA402_010794 [Bradysia odoriphaga]